MLVTVRMFSNFRKFLPPDADRDKCVVEIEQGADVSELLDKLKIPPRMARVITVNDTNRKENYKLDDRDIVKIFPVAMGG
ncbi:MoaD/ThiS family protein [Bacteroidota bacterium]